MSGSVSSDAITSSSFIGDSSDNPHQEHDRGSLGSSSIVESGGGVVGRRWKQKGYLPLLDLVISVVSLLDVPRLHHHLRRRPIDIFLESYWPSASWHTLGARSHTSPRHIGDLNIQAGMKVVERVL